jgi:O-acetyl-ADP-ribose deacetylase (regulator of RNase III)
VKIEVILGNITEENLDAIVNAANNTLLGGGGVDGAIHRAAGPDLLAECRTLGGCATGEARITKGYRLPAKYVIHTVGPVWQEGDYDEEKLLAACYRNSLNLAEKFQLRSIAFPSISTGAYGFPVKRAAKIAINQLIESSKHFRTLSLIRIVCFDTLTFNAYQFELNNPDFSG